MKLCIEMKFEFRSISFEWKVTHPPLVSSSSAPSSLSLFIYFEKKLFLHQREKEQGHFADKEWKAKAKLFYSGTTTASSSSFVAASPTKRQWTFVDDLEQSYLFTLNSVCKFDFRFCIFVSLSLSLDFFWYEIRVTFFSRSLWCELFIVDTFSFSSRYSQTQR